MTIIADSLTDYASYLEDKCQVVKANHHLLSPKRPESGVDMTLDIIEGAKSIKPKLVERYKILNEKLLQADLYQPILVNEFLPLDTRERRRYIDELPHGIPNTLRVFKYTHSSGNNLGNTCTHYVWKVPVDTVLEDNYKVIDKVKSQIKVYHSRAMRNEFKLICGRVSNMKPAVA